MTRLDNHLEQISLSASAIADLPFPPSKIFTNAMLGKHELTNLIRDTEPHERALFSLDPNAAGATSSRQSTRRGTVFLGEDNGAFGRKSMYTTQEPKKESAVARVLGGEMLREIQKSSSNGRSHRNGGGGGVNIEVLLRGAEKLCAVYPVPGATEKIASLRNRYRQTAESVALYEEKVMKQQSRLEKKNKGAGLGRSQSQDDDGIDIDTGLALTDAGNTVTDDDLRLEEQEIKEFEMRKRALEERVTGMEKDLGGLLR